MADNVTNELLLEQLKEIRRNQSLHTENFKRIELELRSMKGHISALVQSDLVRDADQAALLLRVERIERRLDLTDG